MDRSLNLSESEAVRGVGGGWQRRLRRSELAVTLQLQLV
jgi:hypothetical protein